MHRALLKRIGSVLKQIKKKDKVLYSKKEADLAAFLSILEEEYAKLRKRKKK